LLNSLKCGEGDTTTFLEELDLFYVKLPILITQVG